MLYRGLHCPHGVRFHISSEHTPALFVSCSVNGPSTLSVRQESRSWEPLGDDWLSSKWTGFKSPRQLSRIRMTGVDMDVLRSVGERVPRWFLSLKVRKQRRHRFTFVHSMRNDNK